MPIIASIALLLGVLLAPAGTFVYVYCCMNEPDDETLRISKGAAVTGRWSAAAGTAIYLVHAFGTDHGTSPPMLTVLIVAAVAAVATHITKLPPARTPRPV